MTLGVQQALSWLYRAERTAIAVGLPDRKINFNDSSRKHCSHKERYG
jgi:hypothetical protein